MEEGDQFFITVLNKRLTYEVDQIQVVEPEEVEDLAIEKEKDYVTLVTCTPPYARSIPPPSGAGASDQWKGGFPCEKKVFAVVVVWALSLAGSGKFGR